MGGEERKEAKCFSPFFFALAGSWPLASHSPHHQFLLDSSAMVPASTKWPWFLNSGKRISSLCLSSLRVDVAFCYWNLLIHVIFSFGFHHLHYLYNQFPKCRYWKCVCVFFLVNPDLYTSMHIIFFRALIICLGYFSSFNDNL